MRRLTMITAAAVTAAVLSSCATAVETTETARDTTATQTPEPTTDRKPVQAMRAVEQAALVVESRATENMYDNPGRPQMGLNDQSIEADLAEYGAFPEGADISIVWPETIPGLVPEGGYDLGYDLCAELADGSWAQWDPSAHRVKASALTGGCPA